MLRSTAREAGFHCLELMATGLGEPLYRAFGFTMTERVEAVLPNGVLIPFVRMARAIKNAGDKKTYESGANLWNNAGIRAGIAAG